MMTNITKSWMSESDSSYFVFHTVIELICLAEANTNLTFCRISTRWFFNLCAYCAVFIDKLFTSSSLQLHEIGLFCPNLTWITHASQVKSSPWTLDKQMFVISVIVKSTRPTSPERLYERFPGHLVFVSDAMLTLNILGSGKNGVVST